MADTTETADRWVPPSVDTAVDRKTMKSLMRRNDSTGLFKFALCVLSIGLYGWFYNLSWGTWFVVPTVILFGGTMSLFVYSLSHECAHGTAFKTRWLNEAMFWFSSMLFGQEPLYRRYSHAVHHTYTWFWEKDAQMPFTVRKKVGLFTYLRWYTGLEYHFLFVWLAVKHALGRFTERTRAFTPAAELPKMRRNSIIFVAIWLSVGALSIYFQSLAVVWFYIIPKVVGDMISMTFIATQHFEMGEDDLNLLHTTRSIKRNWFWDLYYWNMSYHIEHHYAPTVPFHALPQLHEKIGRALPVPEGVIPITIDVYKAMRNRHLSVEADALRMPMNH
ncbi:MAG: hypothetical protein CL400_04375 [Acidiferrobacteraceae bacterium]|nr:hypothetical protein [Acidiferrobacteraceae bacterium]